MSRSPFDGHGPRTILFARHAETAWNRELRWQGRTDIPLSDIGRAQATRLAQRLGRLAEAGLPVSAIRSSQLGRARETAEIVAAALGVTRLSLDHRLQERAFGVFEGRTRQECATCFPELWARYEKDRSILPPGGEPVTEVVARLEAAVRAALAETADLPGAILVVGHGGATRSLLQALFSRPFSPIANVGLIQVEVENGAFARVEELPDLLDGPD